ncbi:MAG: SIMPL domain-containing protein [Planctomycetes bacterium]|nr:SIMPL domain-containing protein [Planctomycetota bacterium]
MRRFMILTACLALWNAPLSAQEGGVSVTGSATTMVDPDAVKIQFRISGDADEAKDAVTTYLKNEARLLEALEKIKKEDLEVQIGGLTFGAGASGSMAQMIRMQGGDEGAAALTIARECTVTITRIDLANLKGIYDRIAEVIDTGKEAGAELAGGGAENIFAISRGGTGPTPVEFVVTKMDEVRAKVSAEALANAKKNAEQIATQMGFRLGKVLSVSDIPVAAGEGDVNAQMKVMMMMFGGTEQKKPESLKVEVSVTYSVRYAIGE